MEHKGATIGIFIAIVLAIAFAGTVKFYINKGLSKTKSGAQLK